MQPIIFKHGKTHNSKSLCSCLCLASYWIPVYFKPSLRTKLSVSITRTTSTVVGDHLKYSGHALDISSSSILGREQDLCKRRVREAIEIYSRAPTLSRDAGFELPTIYRDVLSRDLQFKSRDKRSNSCT